MGKWKNAVSFLNGDIAPVNEYKIPGNTLPLVCVKSFIGLDNKALTSWNRLENKHIPNPAKKNH